MTEIEAPRQKSLPHLQEVQRLLARHRLVEGLVHRQDMPRHDLVENLVHSQNLVELRKLLDRLEAVEVAGILETLLPEERVEAWRQIRDGRGRAVLRWLPAEMREALVSAHDKSERTMLNAFELHNGRLRQVQVEDHGDLSNLKPIWVDLVAPIAGGSAPGSASTSASNCPTRTDLTDLEASARFYVEDNGEVHLHSDFLLDTEEESRNVPVAFILHRDILFSVRSEELPVFRLQRLRARTQPGYVTDGKDVLLDLYAADAEYSADALEDVYAALEDVSKHVLQPDVTDKEAANILSAIAREEDLNGRIRRNVLDTRRAVSFLMRGKFLSPTSRKMRARSCATSSRSTATRPSCSARSTS